MTALAVISQPVGGKLLGYAAKYNIQHFERKTIPSYAIWTVYLKVGGRYPKVPQGYGAAASYDAAHADMVAFIDACNVLPEYCRYDGTERWAKIKLMISARENRQAKLLKQ